MAALKTLLGKNYPSIRFLFNFVLLCIFLHVPKAKPEDVCQRFILSETTTAKLKVAELRAKIIDAVWSENSQKIRAFTVLGGVLTISIHGFVEYIHQIEAQSEELDNHPRVLLGPSFVLSFDDTGILMEILEPLKTISNLKESKPKFLLSKIFQ